MEYSLRYSFKYNHARQNGSGITNFTTSAIKLKIFPNFGRFKTCLKQNHSIFLLFCSEVYCTFCKQKTSCSQRFCLQVRLILTQNTAKLATSCSLSETSNFPLISCFILISYAGKKKTHLSKLTHCGRSGSFKLFKLFKRPFPGFLTILTL